MESRPNDNSGADAVNEADQRGAQHNAGVSIVTPRRRLEPHHRLGQLTGPNCPDVVPHTAVATGVARRPDLVKQPLRRQPGELLEARIDDPRVGIQLVGYRRPAASSASHPTTGPGPAAPSRLTRGSSADSPRSASTTRPSRCPGPGSASATSSSPVNTAVQWPRARFAVC